MNVLSMHALIGAYSDDGQVWLDELRQVLGGNVDFACDFIAQHFPGVRTAHPQGTYMLFVDCSECARSMGAASTTSCGQPGMSASLCRMVGHFTAPAICA